MAFQTAFQANAFQNDAFQIAGGEADPSASFRQRDGAALQTASLRDGSILVTADVRDGSLTQTGQFRGGNVIQPGNNRGGHRGTVRRRPGVPNPYPPG